jgi:hypothetical protein
MTRVSPFLAALLAVEIYRVLVGNHVKSGYWTDVVAALAGCAIAWGCGWVSMKLAERRKQRRIGRA